MNKKRGFTFVEIIIVITIVAILVAVVFIVFNSTTLFEGTKNLIMVLDTIMV